MTTKFGFAVRFLTLGSLCLAAADHARAGGAVVAAPAPISLTASDGAGLELVSLAADAAIDDPLAFTELHLVFRNPENRVREGRFRITLPSGATVSRFAMRIGDRWQEGEVVEQQAARVAYEDFLHHRQDPALLEAEAGNEFSARVFPIPAGATKEIVISYAQELTRADEPYRLPLRGLPRVGTLAIRAVTGAGKTETCLERHDFTPDRDFELGHKVPGGRLGLRDDNLVVARVVPLAETTAREPIGDLHILVDTSASRALGLADEAAAVERLLVGLRGDSDPAVTVAAFDQDVVPMFTGRASGAVGVVGKRIVARGALGASDLDRALASLASAFKPAPAGTPRSTRTARVLLVTDGVATAGELGADKLRARVAALGALGVRRLDVVAVGGIRDDVMLSRLVTAGLPSDGVVIAADDEGPAIMRRLTHATRSGITIAVDGAGWVWPSVVKGVQPGDEVLVYADLPADAPFRLKVAGVAASPAGALAPTPRPLLERAWVRARIARILEERDTVAAKDRDLAAALKKQAIDLSIQNRVLCPFTSLLVLETEQDYARFGIERRALADVLTVGPDGVSLLHRTEIAAPFAAATAAAADEGRVLPPGVRPQAKGEAPREEKAKKASVSARRDDLSDKDVASPREAEVAAAPPAAPLPVMVAPSGEALQGFGRGGAPTGVGGLAHAAPASAPMPMRAVRSRVATGAVDGVVVGGVVAVPGALELAPVTGAFKEVLDLLRARRPHDALARAFAMHANDPGDVLALVALGEGYEALGDPADAARAYGSIIDLFPGRADMRRFAGERLERVNGARPLALAIDTYRKAVEQRPDHPAGHHLLGFALLKAGHPREAFEALAVGAAQRYPEGRFRGVDRILREDLGLAAAAWTATEPSRAQEIRDRLSRAGGTAENGPSIRFILNWETDANDVDFHIHDARGGHAFFSQPQLPSGGELYADVTTGYGPECFTIRGPAVGQAAPYHLQAHYYSRGPMGYGMGKLQIIDHDGRGNVRFDERPFVIMQDGAFVDLGQVGATLAGSRPVAMARKQRTPKVVVSHVWATAPNGRSGRP
jgi:tetratricopeptide (TPR) repeat protein